MTYILENAHWFILLIGALVFFHELGHFLVAKACGVKVLRFSMGFGPRLFSTVVGETEYRLALLPLGGYVKMLGDVPGSEVPPEEAERAFSNKAVWQRAAIVMAGPSANMLLATVVYLGMLMGPHTVGSTRLGVVTVGDPAYNAGVRPGDTIVAVEGRPVSRWDELREEIARRPSASMRITYERRGERHDVTLTTETRAEENVFQETENRGKIGVSLQYLRPVLAVVDPESPAAQVGLKTGDVVEAVRGHAVGAWHEVRDLVGQTPAGTAVPLRIARDGRHLEVELFPAAPVPGLDSALFSAADTADGGYTGLVNKDVVVARVEPNTPAETAGLAVGDRLLRLTVQTPDGRQVHRPVGVWGIDLSSFGIDPRSELMLTVQRGHAVMNRNFRLMERKESDDFKNVRTTYVLGAVNDPDILDTYTFERKVGMLAALPEALGQVLEDMTLISRGIGKMIQGNIPLNTMGGPIMLFVIAEKSAKRGWQYFLRTMAMISVNLGMLNMLPIPVLDGGHLMFCAIEAVSRRPPSIRTREVANMVGLAMLLLLMVVVFHNDFFRFVLG